jgi:myo-inositol-1(or 4)-monophosphatase
MDGGYMNYISLPIDSQSVVTTLNRVALETASAIKSYYRSDLTVEIKADRTIVTRADKDAENVARKIISETFPEHNILGEEFGQTEKDSPFLWVIDPIDGTTSFAAGSFDFGTVVGLLFEGQPIFGMISQPLSGDVLIGDCRRTYHNGKLLLPINQKKELEQCILCMTDVFTVKKFQKWEPFEELAGKLKSVRTWGNAYAYSLLALGYVDIVLDPIVSVWDIAGVIPIIQGVKGVITSYDGRPFSPSQNDVIAARPDLHQMVVELLQRGVE